MLRYAQATQVIFHAKTKKFVVVLTDADLDKLAKPGGLPRVLKGKMQMVEAWTGLDLTFTETWQHIDLPPHLAQHEE